MEDDDQRFLKENVNSNNYSLTDNLTLFLF